MMHHSEFAQPDINPRGVWLPLELLQERYNYFSMCCIHLYKWQPHADSEDDDENPTFSAVCFLAPVYSKVHSQVFL